VREVLDFQRLAPAEGAEAIRLLFRVRNGTTLDLPVSADSLSELVRTLYLLHGTVPQEMKAEIAQLVRDGKLVLIKP
jgi:hypothetical protein